ncbi:MAG: hypothetical protein Q9181_007170, partial [Wetmoreana brouardii]
ISNGGLAFADSEGRFSYFTSFAYSYLPTLLAVSFGVVWSWVDLDSKRLEPYFQLSKPKGATAKDSLLLHYPFDFIALAPIKAFRRRHWSVFLSGATTTLIFWVVTPLLGAVFTSNRLAHTVNATATTVANLSWTASTDFYTTQLNCASAKISLGETSGYTFDNGQGCRTDTISPLGSSGYNALYIGYYNDPNVDWSLAGLGCPPNASHTFLAIWAGVEEYKFNNVTALFCEPTYSIQRVNATVAAQNHTVSKITPLESPMALPPKHFNVSDFEYLIGAGIQAIVPRADVPQTNTLDQWRRIKNMDVQWPVSNMVGFALGASRHSPVDYFNATVLASSFQAAHRLLFGLAVRKVVSNELSTSDQRPGIIKTDVRAVVVVPELAIIVETTLGLVTMLIFGLVLLSLTRRSQLRRDPASLSDLIDLTKPVTSGTTGSPMKLVQGDHTKRFRLVNGELQTVTGSFGEKYTGVPKSLAERHSPLSEANPLGKGQDHRLVRPLEMTLPVGAGFLVILCLAIAALVTVYYEISIYDGLQLPSKSQATNQLLLNYIPIGFATVLEPFWTLLNRLLCILQPFEALRQGQAKPWQSLDVKYTALPPQLIFWRALRARHFTLVAVCLIGFSANFLAVSLGALFENNIVQLNFSSQFGSRLAPVLNRTLPNFFDDGTSNSYREHFYVARTNITEGTALPPWITPQLYFMPVNIDASSSQETGQLYMVSTEGVGLKASCQQLDATTSASAAPAYNITKIPDPLGGIDSDLILSVTNIEGIKVNCATRTFGSQHVSDDMNRTYAAEVTTLMTPSSPKPSPKEMEICSKMLVVAFLRANLTIVESSPDNPELIATNSSDVEAVYIGCESTLQIASFNVTVDHEGHVKEFRQTGQYQDAATLLPHEGNLSYVYNSVNAAIWNGEYGIISKHWHNDMIADSWLPYLIKIYTQSRAFLDPSLRPPSADSVGSAIEDIYSRLFAILLGLNADRFFLPAPSATTVSGTTIVSRTRIFMSKPMLFVSIVLLVLNVLVAVLYYAKRPRRMLESMPNTIASVLDMTDGSGLVHENANSKSGEQWRIGYGRYVGTDGKPHVGIERRPFVVPWSGK